MQCCSFGQDPRFGRNPYANPYDNPYYNSRRPHTTSPRGRNIYYVLPDEAMGGLPIESAAPRGLPGGGGRFPGGGNPVGGLVSIATNLLLQLPFSRYSVSKHMKEAVYS